jgi:Mg-chelatase subunit ChlD
MDNTSAPRLFSNAMGRRAVLGIGAMALAECVMDDGPLHGTNELGSIGNAVPSGCIRLLNQDVIHLYDNVKSGNPIVVIPDPSVSMAIRLNVKA